MQDLKEKLTVFYWVMQQSKKHKREGSQIVRGMGKNIPNPLSATVALIQKPVDWFLYEYKTGT